MYCDWIQECLSAYLDGEIGEQMRAQLDEHLASCEGCREALARLRQVDALLGSASAPAVSERFTDRVMAQAREHAAGRRQAFREFWSPFHWWESSSLPMRAAAAAVLMVGVAAGAFMARDTWEPAPSQPVVSVQSAEADVLATYNLDYLTDAPSGSLAQIYVTLASAPNGRRN